MNFLTGSMYWMGGVVAMGVKLIMKARYKALIKQGDREAHRLAGRLYNESGYVPKRYEGVEK